MLNYKKIFLESKQGKNLFVNMPIQFWCKHKAQELNQWLETQLQKRWNWTYVPKFAYAI